MSLLAQVNPWEGVAIGEGLFLLSPMIAIICTMLAVMLCPVIVGRSPRTIATVGLIGVLVTIVLALKVAGVVADGGRVGLAITPLLVVDNLSCWFQIILMVFVACITWLWWIGSADQERDAPEFFILLLGSALGMAMMVSSVNLLMIVIAIETASLPSYTLVGFNKRDSIGAEASLKYMVFGAICAAIMLYGASLVYGVTRSLDIAVIAERTLYHLSVPGFPVLLAAGLLCFLVGVLFKISAVPFHYWCPDAFQGAKIEVTTWLSVVSKAAGVLLLARLTLTFSQLIEYEQLMGMVTPIAWIIAVIATITCTVGNFAAYRQESVKRLLAYSSIAHAGYMMMAAAVFLHPDVRGHTAGITALLLYVVVYLFMNLGAFGVTALVQWQTGSDHIDSFNGLARRSPWLMVPMVICLMSLVGLPPFAGFIAKWWVLLALGKMGQTVGWFLVVVAVINTLISLYYYVRIIVRMAIYDAEGARFTPPISGLALVNLCGLALLVLFVAANPLKSAADRFSQQLYSPAVAQFDTIHAFAEAQDAEP